MNRFIQLVWAVEVVLFHSSTFSFAEAFMCMVSVLFHYLVSIILLHSDFNGCNILHDPMID